MNWFDFCSIFVDPKPDFEVGEFGIKPLCGQNSFKDSNFAWLSEVLEVSYQYIPAYHTRDTRMKRDEKTGLFIVDHNLTLPIDKYHPGHQPYTYGGVPFRELRKLDSKIVDIGNVGRYKAWCREWERVNGEWLRNDGPYRELCTEVDIIQLKRLNEALAETLKRTSSPQSAQNFV